MAPLPDESVPELPGASADDRLDSWKEIAAYLQRDVRTVQRWEKFAGLPVHRHPAGRLRTAYAFRSEIDAWWRTQGETVEPPPPAAVERPDAPFGQVPPVSLGSSEPAPAAPAPVRRARYPLAVLLLALPGLLAAGIGGVLPRRSEPAHAAGTPEVLLLPVENRAGNAPLAELLGEALDRETGASGNLRAVAPARVARALRLMRHAPSAPLDLATAREAALRDGSIQFIVAGRLHTLNDRYYVTLQAIDPAEGGVRGSVQWHGKGAYDLVTKASPRVAELARVLAAAPVEGSAAATELEPVTTASAAALRLYTAAVQAGARQQWGASERLARRALAEDPDFPAALAWTAWAMRQQGHPVSETLPPARRAVALASSVTEREAHLVAGTLHAIAGDLLQAIAELEALTRLYPADRQGLELLTDVYFRAGRIKSGVERAVACADRYPDQFDAVVRAAQALTLAAPNDRRTTTYVERARALATPEAVRHWPLAHAWLVGLPVFHEWLANDRQALSPLESLAGTVLTRLGRDRDFLASRIGFAYLTLERPGDAERTFRYAASPERQLNLAMLALVRGDEHGARRWLSEIRQHSQLRPALFARVGLLEDAERGLPLAVLPRHAEGAGAVARGLIDARKGRIAAAELALSRGMDLLRWSGEPEFFFAVEELARLARSRGETDRAAALLQVAAGERAHTYGVTQWTGGYWAKLARDLDALQQARPSEVALMRGR